MDYTWGGKRPVHPCACGCGQEVSIAKRSCSRNGQVKGQPLRYVSGHNEGCAEIAAGKEATAAKYEAAIAALEAEAPVG